MECLPTFLWGVAALGGRYLWSEYAYYFEAFALTRLRIRSILSIPMSAA
jgi:hypothetical protein